MSLYARGLSSAAAAAARPPHLAAALDDHSRFGQALVCIAVGDVVALRQSLQLAQAEGDEVLQRLLSTPGAGDNTLLMHAVQLQNRDAVRVLLLSGADPNVVNARGQTALHLAAQRGEPAALSAAAALLSHEANLEAADADGLTPLLLAARFASGDMLQLLLARGAKVHAVSSDGRSVVTMAVLASNLPALQVVLEHLRATSHLLVADTQDAEGWTALHWACAVGDVDILDLLLEQSPINICLRTVAGETVLHLAAREGDMAVLSTLLMTRPARQAGQLLTMALVRTEGDQTAEDYAVDAGHFACGMLILGRIQELRSMLTTTGTSDGGGTRVHHRNITVSEMCNDDGGEDTDISPGHSDASRSAGTVSLPRQAIRYHRTSAGRGGSRAEPDASATSDSAQYSASSGAPSPSLSSALVLNEGAAAAAAGTGSGAAAVMPAVIATSAASLDPKQQGRTPSSSSSTESSTDFKAEAKRKRRREAWHRREELKRREQTRAHSSVAQLEGEQQALQQVVAALIADRNRLLELFNLGSGGHMQLLHSLSPEDSGMDDADNNADAEAPTLVPVHAVYSTTLESMV